jgi:hypothetical protein
MAHASVFQFLSVDKNGVWLGGARHGRGIGLAMLLGAVMTTTLTGCYECSYYNDCPAGDSCNPETRTCESTGINNGGGSLPLPPPRDSGTGGGSIDVRMQTPFALQWLAVDPRDPNRGMFPIFEANGSLDDLRTFDLATGAIRDPADIDFVGLADLYDGTSGDPCEVDNLYPEPAIPSQHGDPETWLVCKRGAGIRIYYDNNFLQPGMPVEPASEFGYVMMKLNVSGSNTNDYPRRLTFERGGDVLNIYQLNTNTDGVFVARTKDTVEVQLEGITQVWQLASIPQGDVIVVFTRGDGTTPKLVPLLRQVNTETWELATPITALGSLPLPEKTHAVIQIGPIDPNGLSAANVPNVMTVEPETGYLRFFTLNNENPPTAPLESFVTRYELNAQFYGSAPEPEERLLMEPAPGGNATFYMHPRVGRVWRLPHVPNAENDIYRYTILGGATLASGLIPTGAYSTWLSIPSTLELVKVTLAQDN